MGEGSSDKKVETNQEVESDIKLSALVTQLNDLTTKLTAVENKCKIQGRYIHLYERVRFRTDEHKRNEDTLLVILQNLHEQDKMLKTMKESVEELS